MHSPFVAWSPSNLRSLSVALVGLLGLGCSDDGHRLGGVAYRVVDGVKVGACEFGADIEPVDFMEDGDATIELVKERAGVWFSFNDKTGGSQWPATDAEVFEMTELRPPRSESTFAARTTGKDFMMWGAGIGFELKNQKPYDLSRYTGVTFWARRGEESGVTSVRFAVTDPKNAPRGRRCDPVNLNPPCDNYYGATLDLDTEFRRYSYAWSEMPHDPSWGDFDPTSRLDPAAAYGLRFQTVAYEGTKAGYSVPQFDFTIDDVALTCPRP